MSTVAPDAESVEAEARSLLALDAHEVAYAGALAQLRAEDHDHADDAPTADTDFWATTTPELRQLLLHMGGYLLLTDVDHILAVLGAAVAQAAPGDPLWLMVVSPSSSGKGEALRLTDGVAAKRLKDVTLPGLISVKGGKKSGLLTMPEMQGTDALITITDFSAMLGNNRMSGESKSDLYNALRDIYDGEYSRTMHGGSADWRGRLTVIAACTPAIDRFSAYADALGTRFLYFRQPGHEPEARRQIAGMAMRRENLREKRATASALATTIITDARVRIEDVRMPSNFERILENASDLVGYGRASIPRDYRGDIEDVAHAEEPGRLAGQLKQLALGLLALQLHEDTVLRIVLHTAVSSMPVARALVLETLARADKPLSEYGVAERAGVARTVARRVLEDWQQFDYAVADKSDEAPMSRASSDWHLNASKRADVREIFGVAS